VDVLGVSQFVDADLLARSLALSETAPLTAGRAMLRRLDELTRARQSFGFETTLRYRSGLRNFFHLYQALTTTWRMYDNSTHQPRLIASGAGRETLTVNELHLWQRIRAEAGHAG
jgi:predicted ABC-type ATPase